MTKRAATQPPSMTDVAQSAKKMRTAFGSLQAEATAWEKRIADWTIMERRVKATLTNAPNVVKLNVGGTIFQTPKDTLLRVEGSFFHGLLGSVMWNPNDSAYFLDFDPKVFRRVVLFLRTGQISTEGLTPLERGELESTMETLNLNTPTTHEWALSPHNSRIALSNNSRTSELSPSNSSSRQCGATKMALVGTLRIRVDAAKCVFQVGLCSKVAPHATNTRFIDCYLYFSVGFRTSKGTQAPETLSPISPGDVVTICCERSRVKFALNGKHQCTTDLDDPCEPLVPVVFLGAGTKVTILDSSASSKFKAL